MEEDPHIVSSQVSEFSITPPVSSFLNSPEIIPKSNQIVDSQMVHNANIQDVYSDPGTSSKTNYIVDKQIIQNSNIQTSSNSRSS
ncbi:hypothetical protein WA026_014153 [Henosepilachna vigintioctopunctata]|uniref:Uncharacterized protein n=1 Tax=Henosepilachna vigintioctopunctata TaxID=420089 RepID=A0AAW1TU87_9CUCU